MINTTYGSDTNADPSGANEKKNQIVPINNQALNELSEAESAVFGPRFAETALTTQVLGHRIFEFYKQQLVTTVARWNRELRDINVGEVKRNGTNGPGGSVICSILEERKQIVDITKRTMRQLSMIQSNFHEGEATLDKKKITTPLIADYLKLFDSGLRYLKNVTAATGAPPSASFATLGDWKDFAER